MAARADLNRRAEVRFPRCIGRAARVVPQRARCRAGGALADAAGQRRPVRSQSRPRATDRARLRSGQRGRRIGGPRRERVRPEQRLAYFSSARDRVLTLPGVERAAWAAWIPIATVSDGGPFWLESQPPRADEQPQNGRDGSRRSGLLRRRHTFRFSKVARLPIATTRRPRRWRSSTRHSPRSSGRARALSAVSSS